MKKQISLLAAALMLISNLTGTSALAGSSKLINGAGATFPYPIYSKWFSEYSKVNPEVNFNYQSIGSGGGIKQISAMTVDFGASDASLTNEQLRAAPGKLLHIPMVAGAVVIAYNLEGVQAQVNFSPEVIAGIFLEKITSWNDPLIAQDNPGVNFPSLPITVVHRSDGSGTTNIFTDYLSSISETWKSKVGKGTSVSWPTGLGGKGNEGVTATIKQTPGAIGYIELAYAVHNRIAFGTVKNKSGNFIVPSLESTTKAVEGKLSTMPEDFRVSLVNPDGADSYPISGFTWILVYQKQANKDKGQALIDFLRWAIHDGQGYTNELLYASLPPSMVEKIDQRLSEIKI